MVTFRLRLFLIASAIVAVVLAVVMFTGWVRVMDFEVARLDTRLCSEASRLALEHFPATDLPSLEVDIMGKLHLGSAEQLLLQVQSSHSDGSYQSEHWEASLTLPASLPRVRPQENAPAPPYPPDSPPVRRDFSDPSRPPPPPRRPPPPRPAQEFDTGAANANCVLASTPLRGSQWRVARFTQGDVRSTVAADLIAPRTEIRNALFDALLVEIPLALGLSALGAWLLSALMMRPVNRLREAMKAVTHQDLDRRLSARGEDREFRELIEAYNTMLERLERSFLQASRFSADAAHELKTPLTILRGRIEQARRKARSEALQTELSDLLDEVTRLSAITRKLLLLSQADAGRLELTRTPVDLSLILAELMADAEMLASDRQLDHTIAPGLVVQGDAVLLRQLLNNLISNALRYCPPDGVIEVHAQRDRNFILVQVKNSCEHIAAGERERFFERFYRSDSAHTRQVDGHGLGLSLALEIAKAHGGTLVLQPERDDVVRLLLSLPET